jgi:hypothetical protein
MNVEQLVKWEPEKSCPNVEIQAAAVEHSELPARAVAGPAWQWEKNVYLYTSVEITAEVDFNWYIEFCILVDYSVRSIQLVTLCL